MNYNNQQTNRRTLTVVMSNMRLRFSFFFIRSLFATVDCKPESFTHLSQHLVAIPPENFRNLWFSNFFMGYGNGKLAWNGLNCKCGSSLFYLVVHPYFQILSYFICAFNNFNFSVLERFPLINQIFFEGWIFTIQFSSVSW